MTKDEVVAELQTYDQELAGILSRFRETRDGIYIDLKDVPKFSQIGQELIDFITDEFVGGASYANHLGHLMNNSSANYYGTPSKAGIETVKSALASIITRVRRNPEILKSVSSGGELPRTQPDTSAVLERIASRLHVVVCQLRQRHDNRQTLEVVDEYDLQDLVHSLLRLFFDDVRAEEWTPSYAGKSSRIDFLLSTSTTAVELKFVRQRGRKLGDELIIDLVRYKAHPTCKHLVCIVYDPDHLVPNPRGLESDLNKRHDELQVQVMIVPR